MEYVFSTPDRIFFVMKFVRGGEMFTHLRDQSKFSESRAKFYCMNLALGIGYLHSMNCVYRDLKPENILFEEDGYLTITDFGLVKRLEDG
jgi:serum/glucocorticoid-regulated kinase 2